MAIMDISVLPVGTTTPSLSALVSDCVGIVASSGLRYELTSMGTQIEGDLEVLLKLAEAIHSAPFRRGIQRVVTVIKIDDRRDKDPRMDDKKQAVAEHLTTKKER